MTTHDYTVRGWGHDVSIVRVRGLFTDAVGWGSGIQTGHYLLLPNGEHTTRYQVEAIEYYPSPPDMWRAELVFAPRFVPREGGRMKHTLREWMVISFNLESIGEELTQENYHAEAQDAWDIQKRIDAAISEHASAVIDIDVSKAELAQVFE